MWSLLRKGMWALGDAVLDFVYPARCALCGAPLGDEERVVCERCWGKVQIIDGPHCRRCGSPLEAAAARCDHCAERAFRFHRGRVLSSFDETVQALIHLLKYKGKRSVGRRLGRMLGEVLASEDVMEDVDLIAPVPLHRSREKERGYNQSLLLATEIGRCLGVPVEKRILIRARRTASQTKLSAEERVKNVSGAFRVLHAESITGMRILLVDDVLTTGATLNACTEALTEAGAEGVCVATVACPFGG